MSSLCFTKPLRIKGLPEEAAAEWEGLKVGLASMFPYYIGDIQEGPARIWDDEKKIWRFDGPFEHDPCQYARKLMDEYMWISRYSLMEACKYSEPKRPHILAWLESDEGRRFEHFRVSEDVAKYLP